VTFRWRVLLLSAAALIFTIIRLAGQKPSVRSIGASAESLPAMASEVTGMLGDGRLDIDRIQTDTMITGRTHERLVQHHQGLPVFRGELVRQMDGSRAVSIFGRLFQDVSVPTMTPAIEETAAATIAERAVGPDAAASGAELGVLATPGGYVLAYRVTVRSSWDIQTYFINAGTGAIEEHASRIRRQNALITSGTGVLKDSKKVSAIQTSGLYQTADVLRPATLLTLDFRGSLTRLNNFAQTGRVFSSDIGATPSTPWTDGALVDAHVYEGWVYDFYYRQFGRNGLDDHNLEVVGITHPLARADTATYPANIVGRFINNAEYLGDGFILYGDGDGVSFDYLAGALDVVAHELTHGVTEFTSNLDYVDEPGALDEAFSDIMGTSVEFFYEKSGHGPQRGPNFVIGEDVTKIPPGYVRSLQNPISTGNPDHYSLRQYIGTSTDNGGVHFNSTIVSHAFYLAVNGGVNRVSGISVPGVGIANMSRIEKIFYRAFAFLMGPRSQFSDARAATLQAATDLYGASSNERAQVALAWTAVGVQ